MHGRESRRGRSARGSQAARNSRPSVRPGSSPQVCRQFAQHTALAKVPESEERVETARASLAALPRFRPVSRPGCFSLERSPQPISDGQQFSPRFGPKSPIHPPDLPTPPCRSPPLPGPVILKMQILSWPSRLQRFADIEIMFYLSITTRKSLQSAAPVGLSGFTSHSPAPTEPLSVSRMPPHPPLTVPLAQPFWPPGTLPATSPRLDLLIEIWVG